MKNADLIVHDLTREVLLVSLVALNLVDQLHVTARYKFHDNYLARIYEIPIAILGRQKSDKMSLNPTTKQRIAIVLDVSKFVFQWGFIPAVLFLG